MCGDALKLLFKYRGKIYLKASQDDASSRTDPKKATNGGPAQDVSEQHTNSGRSASSPVRGVETLSDTDESEGSQVRVESEKEGSGESEMEISGESDEESSSESSGDSDVIDVQLDSAEAGPNRHSDITGSSDDEGVLLRPVFQSTPVPKPTQQKSKHVSSKTKAPVEEFINTLYGSVVSSGARAEAGVCMDASEVGTVEEVHDHLLAAETDRESGPAHDIRVLQRLLSCNNVPQRLPFLCLGAPEMRLQSHEDCRPVLIIHYQPTDKTVAMLRSIMQSAECLKALGDFNIHAALVGSSFEDKALEKQGKRDGEVYDVELRIMHPTMTSSRMVVGNIVSGHERNFLEKLLKAVEEACQAAAAAHRAVIQEDRVLKRKQEEALRLSELNDRRKAQRVCETNSQTEDETECDDTIVDTDEVRQKRILALSEQTESSKCQRREPDEGNDGDDSGTVTVKTS